MIKEYCDICGKEAETTKYILPDLVEYDIKDKLETIIRKENIIKPKEKDVCQECAERIFRVTKHYIPLVINNIPFSFSTQDGCIVKVKYKKGDKSDEI